MVERDCCAIATHSIVMQARHHEESTQCCVRISQTEAEGEARAGELIIVERGGWGGLAYVNLNPNLTLFDVTINVCCQRHVVEFLLTELVAKLAFDPKLAQHSHMHRRTLAIVETHCLSRSWRLPFAGAQSHLSFRGTIS
jgi:hypothetical protein